MRFQATTAPDGSVKIVVEEALGRRRAVWLVVGHCYEVRGRRGVLAGVAVCGAAVTARLRWDDTGRIGAPRGAWWARLVEVGEGGRSPVGRGGGLARARALERHEIKSVARASRAIQSPRDSRARDPEREDRNADRRPICADCGKVRTLRRYFKLCLPCWRRAGGPDYSEIEARLAARAVHEAAKPQPPIDPALDPWA